MRKAFLTPLSQVTAIRRQSVAWNIGGAGRGIAVTRALAPLPTHSRRPITNCAVRCDNGHGNSYSYSNGAVGNDKATTGTGTAGTAAAAAAAAANMQATQSQSELGPVGVAAALAAVGGNAERGKGGGAAHVRPTLWDEFSLRDRVAIVSGANRGLGLEMALTLVEAGARVVYCVDLPAQPGEEWAAVAEYVKRIGSGNDGGVGGRLEYVSADVRDQKAMWRIGKEIGDREGRMDVCVAAAGILRAHTDCLEYPAEEFEEVRFFRCFVVSFCVYATDHLGWVIGLILRVYVYVLGDGRQHERGVVHCAGCRKTDGTVRE